MVGIRHLTALAKREHRGPDTVVAGAIMHTCIDLFTLEPQDGSIYPRDSYDELPAPSFCPGLKGFRHIAHNCLLIDGHKIIIIKIVQFLERRRQWPAPSNHRHILSTGISIRLRNYQIYIVLLTTTVRKIEEHTSLLSHSGCKTPVHPYSS